MWHSFPGQKFSIINKSAAVSAQRARERISAAAYWQLSILLFVMTAWGLHEEDVEHRTPNLMRDQQLFQCPVCDRQRVAPPDADLTCRGRIVRRHSEEQMIPVGRRN